MNKNSDIYRLNDAEHGDDYKGSLVANFSSNVWYNADLSVLSRHLNSRMNIIGRYPEEHQADLCTLLAENLQTERDELLITNGSVEGIYLIAQCFAGSVSLIIKPTFSEYEKACRLNNHKIVHSTAYDIEKTLAEHKPGLAWICTPNNPNGRVFDAVTCEKLLQQFPHITFVFDISFREFCQTPTPFIGLAQQYSNAVFLYSFTKRYAVPGLRMGYICSNKAIIKQIGRYAIPWSVNALAAEAIRFFISNYSDNFNINNWLKDKDSFVNALNELDGFEAIESSTPFFLLKLKRGKAADLKKHLLQKQILVRDASSFFDDNSQYIRLLTLQPDKNNLLIQEIKLWQAQLQ